MIERRVKTPGAWVRLSDGLIVNTANVVGLRFRAPAEGTPAGWVADYVGGWCQALTVDEFELLAFTLPVTDPTKRTRCGVPVYYEGAVKPRRADRRCERARWIDRLTRRPEKHMRAGSLGRPLLQVSPTTPSPTGDEPTLRAGLTSRRFWRESGRGRRR